MNVYEAHHSGHYLGGVSIIVAETEEAAWTLLTAALMEHGLPLTNAKIMRRLNTDEPRCFVVWNGNY